LEELELRLEPELLELLLLPELEDLLPLEELLTEELDPLLRLELPLER
jgi:hypothetical protein